jgi:hypothetical protein
MSECETDTNTKNAVAWAEINGKFDKMIQSIDMVKDRQEEMADDVAKIKEAVYNPDSGLYARLRELENWKETSSRLIWMVVTALITLTVATLYKSFL